MQSDRDQVSGMNGRQCMLTLEVKNKRTEKEKESQQKMFKL